MTTRVEVIEMTEEHWQRLRDLRLEMLADTPKAYVETLESALAADEPEWRFRARRANLPGGRGVVAVDRELDRFVGTMSSYTDTVEGSGRTWVVAVYVAPDYRGHADGRPDQPRVADAMLDEIEAWASEQGRAELWLEVHAENERAQAFYLRRGYAFTGRQRPYELDDTELELEMRRTL
jgi:ribosomal protein S18 acetylase RimI-like enzyme